MTIYYLITVRFMPINKFFIPNKCYIIEIIIYL